MKSTKILLVLSLGFVLAACTPKETAVEPNTELDTSQATEALEVLEESLASLAPKTEPIYRVKGPAGWLEQPSEEANLVYYVSPHERERFVENITIAVQPRQDLDLAAYAQKTASQATQLYELEVPPLQNQTQFKGQNAMQMSFLIPTEAGVLRTQQLIVERPESWLMVTYLADEKHFEAEYENYENLLASLEFIEGEEE